MVFQASEPVYVILSVSLFLNCLYICHSSSGSHTLAYLRIIVGICLKCRFWTLVTQILILKFPGKFQVR